MKSDTTNIGNISKPNNCMKKIALILTLSLFSYFAFCQTESKTDFNFGFEKISNKGQLPDNWMKWGTADYKLSSDTIEKHSGRTSLSIELIGASTDQSFGSCGYAIPAVYKGNQIELRGYMKLQNIDNGRIGLMLRIDGANGTLQFDNMMQRNIHGTSDWTLYSIVLPLPKNAKTIFIGPILSGTGKLWIDDIQLLIDGEDIGKAKQKEQQVYKADNDKEFDKGSNITIPNLTPAKIEDLAILGKVWGFLKYYHPAVAKGDYNWDYELFRILPEVLQCKRDKERNEILSKWILSLGEVTIETHSKIEDSAIKFTPDYSWINNSLLGEELTKQLLNIRDAKRGGENYYLGFEQSVGNPEFNNERPYNNILPKPDAGYRLLSLYRYWNVIQYLYPYKNLFKENWNDVLTEFIPKFINTTSELDYKLTVLALIALIHDTHANIWGNDETLQAYKGANDAPINVIFIENQAVVTGFIKTKSGNAPELQKGDIIVSVNNKSVDKIIQEKLPITPASNYSTQLRDIARDLLRTNDSVLNITYKRGNSIIPLTLKCYSPKNINVYENYYKKDTCFKLITPEIGYIYPGTIKNNYLPKIMSEVQKTKGLIIDLRCYPSEFIVFSLSEYLMPDSISFVKFSNTSLNTPGLFTYTKALTVGKSNKEYFKGKVIILVNEITQSQAEYTTMALRVAPNATVLGSTTAGADGNVSQFTLPGGINTMISGIGVYYPDGKETQRIGMIPDIVIKPTIKGIKQDSDELIEKAIELINKR
jgi:hypothetical protein